MFSSFATKRTFMTTYILFPAVRSHPSIFRRSNLVIFPLLSIHPCAISEFNTTLSPGLNLEPYYDKSKLNRSWEPHDRDLTDILINFRSDWDCQHNREVLATLVSLCIFPFKISVLFLPAKDRIALLKPQLSAMQICISTTCLFTFWSWDANSNLLPWKFCVNKFWKLPSNRINQTVNILNWFLKWVLFTGT